MSTNSTDPVERNTQMLRESREGVRSLQFFVAAMAAQIKDLTDRLLQVEPVVTGAGSAGDSAGATTYLARERDDARQEVERLNGRIAELERQIESLQSDLERHKVSFADHHSARQEIARLRAELEGQSAVDITPAPAEDAPDAKKRRLLGRS